MLKKMSLALALVLGVASYANADQVVCRGNETTLRLTDYTSYDSGPYVLAQLWTAGSDSARQADLFVGVLNGRHETIDDALALKTFTVKSHDGSALAVSWEKKALQYLVDGSVGTDTFNCKRIKMQTINSDYVGNQE